MRGHSPSKTGVNAPYGPRIHHFLRKNMDYRVTPPLRVEDARERAYDGGRQ
jgi:hypothetical protein